LTTRGLAHRARAGRRHPIGGDALLQHWRDHLESRLDEAAQGLARPFLALESVKSRRLWSQQQGKAFVSGFLVSTAPPHMYVPKMRHCIARRSRSTMVRLADFPQLRLLAWNRSSDDVLDDREALALYEANWRFVDQARLSKEERALIDRLVTNVGQGVLLV